MEDSYGQKLQEKGSGNKEQREIQMIEAKEKVDRKEEAGDKFLGFQGEISSLDFKGR